MSGFDDLSYFGDFNSGPGFGFTIMPIIFFIVFGLVITIFIIVIVKGLKQWTKNNNSPVYL